MSAKELILLNCGVGKDPWSLGHLDCKEIQPVSPTGNLYSVIGRTDTEAPILWPPDGKSQLIRRDPDVERSKAGGEGDNRG